jgi:hypothetical protein
VTIASTKRTGVLVLTGALLPAFLGALDDLISRAGMGKGMEAVFWASLLASFLSIIMCSMMPERKVAQ